MGSEKYLIETTPEKEVRIRFFNPMDAHEWKIFGDNMVRMLKNGFLKWRFILKDMNIATSVDLGMWVSCNATVNNYSGEIDFVVRENSTIHRTLVFTKLEQILSVTLV